MKFRVAMVSSTFTAEALAIGETLDIYRENRLGANLHDFLGLGKRVRRYQ
jgi:hypothetical protein